MSVLVIIACCVIGVILFGVGVTSFDSYSPFFTILGVSIISLSFLLFCCRAFFDVREKNAQNQN